jgi:peptidoglycan/xylan/chitin deacetylase (PgdA/CDA1 family)
MSRGRWVIFGFLLGWGLASYAGAAPAVKPTPRPKNKQESRNQFPLILYYHQFSSKSRDAFRAQLQGLKEQGYQAIQSEDLVRALATGTSLPEKSVLIHIDDVYESAYRVAVPLLREFKMKAEFFAHTQFVGSEQGARKMTWAQLRELESDPLFQVSSHTLTHPDLRKTVGVLPAPQCRDYTTLLAQELKQPILDLEKQLKPEKMPAVLAYPMGKYNSSVRAAAQEYYLLAYATELSRADSEKSESWIYEIPRTKMEPHYDLQETIAEHEKRVSRLNLQSETLKLPENWKKRAKRWLHSGFLTEGMK